MDAFIDGQGVPFSRYRELLPKRARDFPKPERVKDDQVIMAYRWRWTHCQVCGQGQRDGVILDVHHIIGGTKGRSDEKTNLISLDRDCHDKANTLELPKGLILWCKWRTDRRSVSWVRLAILHRQFLPDLIIDTEQQQKYEQNVHRRKMPWRCY